MALTYQQSSDLMNDFQFRGRIKVAALKYATALFDEAANVEWHNSHVAWAQKMYQNPDAVATQLHSPVVMDAAVQSAGAAITDDALQGAVEALVKKLV